MSVWFCLSVAIVWLLIYLCLVSQKLALVFTDEMAGLYRIPATNPASLQLAFVYLQPLVLQQCCSDWIIQIKIAKYAREKHPIDRDSCGARWAERQPRLSSPVQTSQLTQFASFAPIDNESCNHYDLGLHSQQWRNVTWVDIESFTNLALYSVGPSNTFGSQRSFGV